LHSSQAVGRLVKSDAETEPALVESLLTTMTRLLRWFICRNDPTSSAECLNLLQKVYSFGVKSTYFLGSPSDLVSVSAKFEDLVPIFCSHSDTQAYPGSEHCQIDSVMKCLTISLQNLPELSPASTSADIQALLSSPGACDEITLQLMDEEIVFESSLSSEMHPAIQKRMLVTTMSMLRAKLHINAGRPTIAAKYLEWCRAHCRDLLNSLRSARSRVNHLILDDIAIQVDDMLTLCYERLAVANYLQGIRRKAEDFALLAVMKLRILNIDKFGQVNTNDLMDSFERHDGHECILYLIRSLMKMKTLSTSPGRVTFQEILIEGMEWMRDIDSDDEAFCINRLLTKSKNVLACK
jgi:hypothetical protein